MTYESEHFTLILLILRTVAIAAAADGGDDDDMMMCCVQSVLIPVDETSTVGEVLTTACSRRQLNVVEHFLRLKSNVDIKGNVRDAVNVPDSRSRLLTQVTSSHNVVFKRWLPKRKWICLFTLSAANEKVIYRIILS